VCSATTSSWRQAIWNTGDFSRIGLEGKIAGSLPFRRLVGGGAITNKLLYAAGRGSSAAGGPAQSGAAVLRAGYPIIGGECLAIPIGRTGPKGASWTNWSSAVATSAGASRNAGEPRGTAFSPQHAATGGPKNSLK